jgi:hypothetical protein
VSTETERFSFDALRLIDRALIIAPNRTLHLLRAASAVGTHDGETLIESARGIVSSIELELQRSYSAGYGLSNPQLRRMEQNLRVITNLLQGDLVRDAQDRAGEVRNGAGEVMRYLDAYGVTVE